MTAEWYEVQVYVHRFKPWVGHVSGWEPVRNEYVLGMVPPTKITREPLAQQIAGEHSGSRIVRVHADGRREPVE